MELPEWRKRMLAELGSSRPEPKYLAWHRPGWICEHELLADALAAVGDHGGIVYERLGHDLAVAAEPKGN